MRPTAVITLAIAVLGAALIAQETKPVPKDSVRVTVPGCTKGYIFTAGAKTADEPARGDVPEGMRIRMNAPKKMMAEIKAHEGSMIEITGLMKKGQYMPGGVGLGGGVRLGAGQDPTASVAGSSQMAGQIQIDVEGWRPFVGSCPSR